MQHESMVQILMYACLLLLCVCIFTTDFMALVNFLLVRVCKITLLLCIWTHGLS